MKQYIQGDDVFLYIKVDGTFMPICCLIDNPLDESTEEIETTARGSNGFRSYIPGVQDYRLNLNAFAIVDSSCVSYRHLTQLKRDRIIFEWLLQDPSYEISQKGFAFISSIQMTSQTNDLVTFSATLTPYIGGITDYILLWSEDGFNVVSENGDNLVKL